MSISMMLLSCLFLPVIGGVLVNGYLVADTDGVVWCGVVWCGVGWGGVVWCGMVWCGVVQNQYARIHP